MRGKRQIASVDRRNLYYNRRAHTLLVVKEPFVRRKIQFGKRLSFRGDNFDEEVKRLKIRTRRISAGGELN